MGEKARAQEMKDRTNKIAEEKLDCLKFIKSLDRKVDKMTVSEICNIKMKMGDGSTELKKFPATENVKVVFKWAKSLGFPNCVITQRFPKIRLNDYLEKRDHLSQILGRSAQLMLEDNSVMDSTDDEENEESSEEDSD